MSYQKACSPGKNTITAEKKEAYITIEYSCCNSLHCNQQSLPAVVAIECYVCDSRVTGLMGCSILNTSSPHVHEFGSSSTSESCATIVGLAGHDALSNRSYPAFTIRTYIADCRNQSLGVVSYGGATFTGRISCCHTNSCNTEPLDIYLTPRLTISTVPAAIRTKAKGTTTTTTTAKTIQTTTAITETIEGTIKNAGTKARSTTTAATKNESGFHILKTVAITISIVLISCGLILGIWRVTRCLDCKTAQSRDRNHHLTGSVEEIPVFSPMEPSSQPFIQNYNELS
ncbi:unnamed protein product [Adineta steineri]|uniref:Uncharacterized protein n=1 Tax=Adineta steineri TaxID=433720 RepID=A0A814SUP8_9BILA|nr:unnamed protein product [Adineta steineri]